MFCLVWGVYPSPSSKEQSLKMSDKSEQNLLRYLGLRFSSFLPILTPAGPRGCGAKTNFRKKILHFFFWAFAKKISSKESKLKKKVSMGGYLLKIFFACDILKMLYLCLQIFAILTIYTFLLFSWFVIFAHFR